MERLAALAAASALAAVLTLSGCASGASSSSAGTQTGSSESATSASVAAADMAAGQEAGLPSGADPASSAFAPGVYSATFQTDSSMFHVNEAAKGKGELAISDDGMTIHVSLVSKKIVKLYAGTAEQAKSDEANAIEPTTDTVTYSDGYSEEVYGFDIPVPMLDEEFDVAILGEKGVWYDHKVSVTNPVAE